MGKYFIDCGAHVGESVRLFRTQYPGAGEHTTISFEPNPKAAKIFASEEFADVEFHNKAVWLYDGSVKLFDHVSPYDYGLSLHPEMDHVKKTFKEVPCTDLSRMILQRFTKADEIVLKLDIEGSEYELLDKMFKDGSFDYVSKLYIEWHACFRPTITKEEHDRIEAEVSRRGVRCLLWDAMGPNPQLEL